MILIALSWFIFFFIFLSNGFVFSTFVRIPPKSVSITLLLGLFFQTVTLTITSIFYKIGLVVFIINCLLSCCVIFIYQKEIFGLVCSQFDQLKKYTFPTKALLFIILLTALKTSSDVPFLIDNESYYIQSIKWINEYGLVKGLANLHLFLGQMSPFHILQAGYNFTFLSARFNDLNGFILVVCMGFFVQKMVEHMQDKSMHWIGFIVLFYVLFLQFVSQPSPDLSLILITPILLYLYTDQPNSTMALRSAILLFCFIVFIKITIAPLGLLILWWCINKKEGRVFFLITLLFIGLLFCLKNVIITGYPLYPFQLFAAEVTWKLPETIPNLIGEKTTQFVYFGNNSIKNANYITKFIYWIQLKGLNQLFNWGILLLFALCPFTRTFRLSNSVKIAYFVLAIHFILIFLKSPQFRFFLPELVFLAAITASEVYLLFKLKANYMQSILIGVILLTYVLSTWVNLNSLTKNKFHQTHRTFSLNQLIIPNSNTKFPKMEFDSLRLKNLNFYSPKENFFLYGTAEGPLPCVNKKQVKFIYKKTGYIPQQLDSTIGGGFYSLKYQRDAQ